MQTKFRRHQKVKLLSPALSEDTEFYSDEEVQIKAGQTGEINVILPNGRYHVKISDKKGNTIAYVVMDEENLKDLEDG